VQRVRSGVVRIEVTACTANGVEQFVGTGFLVGPRLVATVEHVVDGAALIVIKQSGDQVATATVIGADSARDLALLRLSEPVKGYAFTISRVAPRIGDEVAALGFPFGLPFTMTRGSISGLDRTIPIENIDRQRLVQTYAAVNPGNSGGPLLRTDTGEVVGLVDLGGGADVHGIAFAVSSQVASPLLAAWRAAPQPIGLLSCAGLVPPAPPPPATTPAPPPPPPPNDRGVGVPTVYQGRFTSVDRLERCNVTWTYVYCTAGPSRRAVKLTVGADVVDLGVRGSQDLGGHSMPEETSFTTPNAISTAIRRRAASPVMT
jgi:Trypsin-like peptidase domain